ncbi:MAG: AAA family ATPase [Candidatus Adiutrix sp.]|jgi:energy-coupling factor transporter ATP-binding protein EcfA2|nr:AAA family ATPase [Candidatus Adiutrix sp.]
MIKSLELKNFTAFKDLRIEFSPGINVIIGENGTGKTKLLNAAYALCSPCGIIPVTVFPDHGHMAVASSFTKRLVDIFLPLHGMLGHLYHVGSDGEASLSVAVGPNAEFQAMFLPMEPVVRIAGTFEKIMEIKPTLIPTKEVLSLMQGFERLYKQYQIQVDETYADICAWLGIPPLRSENMSETIKDSIKKIEVVCGGRFVFDGIKVSFFANGHEYSVNSIAEGFRKFGALSRLLENGVIEPGVRGPLFWDEPDSNLNPALMKLLVQILLELSRNGQQIILATHDYVLLKWFDLLMDKGKEDHVRYHSLYRDKNSKEIKLKSSDDYISVSASAISDTFAELYDEEVNRALR